MTGAQGLVCIFAECEDRCVAAVEGGKQHPTGVLHLDYSSPVPPAKENDHTEWCGHFLEISDLF